MRLHTKNDKRTRKQIQTQQPKQKLNLNTHKAQIIMVVQNGQ